MAETAWRDEEEMDGKPVVGVGDHFPVPFALLLQRRNVMGQR